MLVLTTFDLDEYVFGALRAGASGFLLKDAPGDQLVAAIRVVAAGSALLADTVTRRLIERFVEREDAVPPPGAEELTPRELEMLRLVARGLANADIARRLHLSEHTVKTHVAHVLAKLGLRDRTQAVVIAYEAGIVRPGELDDGAAGRSPSVPSMNRAPHGPLCAVGTVGPSRAGRRADAQR